LGGDYTPPGGDTTYLAGTQYLNFSKLVKGQYEVDANGQSTNIKDTDKPGIGDFQIKEVEVKEHRYWLFSFRFVDRKEGPTGAFRIESESAEGDPDWFAPSLGGWLKTTHDGMVVTSRGRISQAIEDAEHWQIELSSGIATSTDPVVGSSSIRVIAGEGSVTILDAAGKQVVISNVLGQTVTRNVLTSDRATLSTPKGVILIAVAGEPTVKAIVK
jgi:hypothetical protein